MEFAVIRGEDDVEVLVPALRGDPREHPTNRLVDEFHLDGVHRVHFSHLIGGHRGRHPLLGRLVVRHDASVVPEAPVTSLLV